MLPPVATKLLGAFLLLFSLLAYAEPPPAATVVALVGTVSAQQPGGKVRLLCQGATLSALETVSTQKNSYVRLRFTDGGQITLRPQTSLRLDSYHFNEAKPAQDNLVFSLLKGGMRAISGLIGHRGNPDAYQAKAGVATIGIRGTHYGMLLCQDNCQALLDTAADNGNDAKNDKKRHEASLGNGLYVEVSYGEIVVSNDAGSRDYSVGQYGYVGNAQETPTRLSQDPGLSRVLPSDMDNSPGLSNLPGIRAGAACVAN